MTHLPVETCTEIISLTSGKKELVALSLTCKLFGTIAQPKLFANIDIIYTAYFPEDGPHNLPMARFISALVKRPDLGRFIHSISLSNPFAAGLGRYRTPSPSWISVFSTLSTLRDLHLMGFAINSDFYTNVYSLPRLKKISFESCILHRELIQEQTGTALGPLVSDLAINRVPQPVFTIFMLRNMPETLTSLNVLSDVDTLVPFLEHLPQLRRLRIPSQMTFPPTCELAAKSIPLLEEYAGPAEYATIFVPGRPVRTVEMGLGSTIKPSPGLFLPLQNSTSVVAKLTVNYDYDTLHSQLPLILQNLPLTVRHFVLGTTELSKSDLTPLQPILSRLPNLCILECKLKKCATDTPILQLLAEWIPTLEEFTFRLGSGPNGDRIRWLQRRPDRDWERYHRWEDIV